MLITDISNVMPSPRSITRTLPVTAAPRPRSDATRPGEGPGAASVSRFEEKIEAGARFFQTQAIYSLDAFDGFMKIARAMPVYIIAGRKTAANM